MNRFTIFGVGIILAIVLLLVGFFAIFDYTTIKGNEIGIKESYFGGVSQTTLPPRTYFRNRWMDTFYRYSVENYIYTLGKGSKTPDDDVYTVQSSDRQDMHISLNVMWKIDVTKAIQLHTDYHAHVDNGEEKVLESRLIGPIVKRIVKNHVTQMTAMQAYSGETLVKLQTEIEQDLTNPNEELRQKGVIVDNFVIIGIDLDPNYTAEIKAIQIAQQKKLRADEEAKAAKAEALKAKEVAQADLNKAVVEAERDKQVAILKAQQEAQAKITAAEAAKQQVIAEAEGQAQRVKLSSNAEKEAAEARASAIKAIGAATAEAERLKFSAYSAPGADVFAMIQVSSNLSTAFGGIQGYLPQGMSVNLLTEDFTKAVKGFITPPKTVPTGK